MSPVIRDPHGFHSSSNHLIHGDLLYEIHRIDGNGWIPPVQGIEAQPGALDLLAAQGIEPNTHATFRLEKDRLQLLHVFLWLPVRSVREERIRLFGRLPVCYDPYRYVLDERIDRIDGFAVKGLALDIPFDGILEAYLPADETSRCHGIRLALSKGGAQRIEPIVKEAPPWVPRPAPPPDTDPLPRPGSPRFRFELDPDETEESDDG